MGLLDELDRKNRRRTGLIQNLHRGKRQPLPKAPGGTHWVTPTQAAREKKQLIRQLTGTAIAVAGWVAAGVLSSVYGLVAVPVALIILVLFTVWGVVTAYSHNDKELKRHAWKTWREFKSLFKRK
jgi:hypothetical protein